MTDGSAPRTSELLQLPSDLLRAVREHIDSRDELCAALCCTALRACWTILRAAPRFDDLRMLQWACSAGYRLSRESFVVAASDCRVEVLAWIRDRVGLTPRDLVRATVRVCTAAENYDVAALVPRWEQAELRRRRAAALDYLETECGVRFDAPTPRTNYYLYIAAFHMQLDVLKHMRKKACWALASHTTQNEDGGFENGHDVVADLCYGARCVREAWRARGKSCSLVEADALLPAVRWFLEQGVAFSTIHATALNEGNAWMADWLCSAECLELLSDVLPEMIWLDVPNVRHDQRRR